MLKSEGIKSEVDLQGLAELLKEQLSFKHATIADARKTINVGVYSYTFDATTLLPYKCNLSYAEGGMLDKLLYPYFKNLYCENREAYKELVERRVLLRFLQCAPKEYLECVIKKQVRPDFVLEGNKRIGVEVTELITEFDKDFFALSREICENGINSEEKIKLHIKKYHKGLAEKIVYVNDTNTTNISTGCHCLTPARMHFAEEIRNKYKKYKDMINQYDEFIILGNAASGTGLDISQKGDVV